MPSAYPPRDPVMKEGPSGCSVHPGLQGICLQILGDMECDLAWEGLPSGSPQPCFLDSDPSPGAPRFPANEHWNPLAGVNIEMASPTLGMSGKKEPRTVHLPAEEWKTK